MCPVDKIVQGMWKNLLQLLTALLEIISGNFSRPYGNVKIRDEVTEPFEKFIFSASEGEVFPIFSTKAVKELAKSLFFCHLNRRGPLLALLVHLACNIPNHSVSTLAVCSPGQHQPDDPTVCLYSSATT
jgi:hypothetical protein